jgi:hypothetical protein
MITVILLTLAFAPLVLLVAFILADSLGLKLADRILDWTMIALISQWRAGCLLNILLGLLSIAGGVYFAIDFTRADHCLAAVFLTLFGLWRIWRGIAAWPRSNGHDVHGPA